MPTDLTVVLTDEPGQLAKLGGATGAAGINIQGLCAFTGEGRGIIHVLVPDRDAARAVRALWKPASVSSRLSRKARYCRRTSSQRLSRMKPAQVKAQ